MHSTSNHQSLCVHSNGICVLGVLASHPQLQPPLTATNVAFRSHDSKDLLNMAQTRGKKKKGAIFVSPRDMVSEIEVSDGSSFTVYGCVRASVIEVNKRLVERPELLGTPEGYLAVMMPKVAEKGSIGQACLDFDRDAPLSEASSNAKRKLDRPDQPVRSGGKKKKKKPTKPCHEFAHKGTCAWGDACRFAHGSEADEPAAGKQPAAAGEHPAAAGEQPAAVGERPAAAGEAAAPPAVAPGAPSPIEGGAGAPRRLVS